MQVRKENLPWEAPGPPHALAFSFPSSASRKAVPDRAAAVKRARRRPAAAVHVPTAHCTSVAREARRGFPDRVSESLSDRSASSPHEMGNSGEIRKSELSFISRRALRGGRRKEGVGGKRQLLLSWHGDRRRERGQLACTVSPRGKVRPE